jgi:hypothetical protein
MSINLHNETLLTLNQAARMLPPSRRGRPVSLSCIYRWVLDGVKTATGKIRLEALRIGGRWLTSAEALERFAVAQTPSLTDRPPLPRTLCARRLAAEKAEQALAKIGI